MSIKEYLSGLTLDQLRFARDHIDKRLQDAKDAEKKIVWRVIEHDMLATNFREDDYQKAVDYFLGIFEKECSGARDAVLKERSTSAILGFRLECPRIEAQLVSEVEYNQEFFPEPPEGA